MRFNGDQPWLGRPSIPLLSPATLLSLARGVDATMLRDCEQVKAFRAGNSAESWFYRANDPLSFICFREACGGLGQEAWGEPSVTIAGALAHTRAPISARIASSVEGSVLSAPLRSAGLSGWLSELDQMTGRPYLDVDAYCTTGRSSASLGWHVDDVGVLLLMLRGSKRFRVAGSHIGSHVTIDHTLKAGDVLYIPPLTFHTGGGSRGGWGWGASDGDSVMLSVALPWADEASERAAQAVTASWRDAQAQCCDSLPPLANTWSFAATPRGSNALARLFAGSEASRFLA